MPKRLSRKKAEEMREEGVQYHKDAVEKFHERLMGLTITTSFYRGNQHGRTGMRGFNPYPSHHNEANETHNYIRPFVRSAVSDMLRSIPNPEVVASHTNPSAMARARSATQLAQSFLRNGVVRFETLYSAALAAQIHGACWMKVSWDSTGGPSSEEPKLVESKKIPGLMEPELDVFGDEVLLRQSLGEIKVEHVNIAEALPDPTAKTEEDIRYIVHLKAFPVTKLEEMFPGGDYFGEEIQWDRNYRTNEGAEEALAVSDPYDEGSFSSTHQINDQAELAFIYEKPTQKYSRGRQIILHGETLLHVDRLPSSRFPFVLLRGQNLVESSLYADGLVKDLIGPQRSMNRAASKQREMLDRCVTPWLLEPRGAELKMDELSDMPGSIVTYNYGFQPKYIDHPPIDPSTFKYMDNLVAVMKDVSTYSEVSRGDAPQGITSGRALAYLAEFERGVHAPDVQLFKDSITKIMRLCLREAADRYEEGRLVQMLGPNNEWMVSTYKQKDFDFDHELSMEVYSGAPNSRAMRYGEALEALQVGGLTDDPSAERFRRIVGWDYQGRSTNNADSEHKMVAESENTQFREDPYAQIRVAMEDNHDLHIDSHNRYRISHEYRYLPDQVRQIFDAHVAEHEDIRAQQLQGYAQEQNLLLNQTEGMDGGAPPPAAPGIESPMDGGAPLYESSPETPGMEQMSETPQGLPSGYPMQ